MQELTGKTEEQVISLLGKPDEQEEGKYWAGEKPGEAWMRDFSGELVETALFGHVPQRIPKGNPYRLWIYSSVLVNGDEEDPKTWLLYFEDHKDRSYEMPRTVTEAYEYPSGAHF